MRLYFFEATEEMVSALEEIPQMQEWVSENNQVLSETFTFTCFRLANHLKQHSKKASQGRRATQGGGCTRALSHELPGPPGPNDNFNEKPDSNIDFHAKTKMASKKPKLNGFQTEYPLKTSEIADTPSRNAHVQSGRDLVEEEEDQDQDYEYDSESEDLDI